jgi:hypothetical protein
MISNPTITTSTNPLPEGKQDHLLRHSSPHVQGEPMTLDERTRSRLNEILEGHSMVSTIRLDLSNKQARVVLKFLPDSVPQMEQHCRILQFFDLRRVSVFTYDEKLPEELAAV